eukprot:gnl/MRDRNA2_/MRDRNA2_99526_c0_seq1.p1 gnl/MRDRNA2_/MRDRNA2_99526_c0~~gnl/MRDRNA2_/MRDRNA2_99526_c0_seq1.p1  ORF type:complete len:456 (+),score=101.57 gnl/MRDRNA2_/MRDRNA2_99526_c0_seq1:98-1465(+)
MDGGSNNLDVHPEDFAVQTVMGIMDQCNSEIAHRHVFSITPAADDSDCLDKTAFGDEDATTSVELSAKQLAFVSQRSLDLSGKGLQKLTAATVSRLTHLVELNLSLNPLQDPQCLQCVQYMSVLRELFLNGCKLNSLPEGLGGLRHLQLLSAEGCGMKDLPSNSLPPCLKILALGKNALCTLPTALSHRPLEKVLLNDNQLEDVQGLSGTSTIEVLNLESNVIKKVPQGILRLPKLSCLSLAGNKLELENSNSTGQTIPESNDKMALVAAAGDHPGLRGATAVSAEALLVADIDARKPLGSAPPLEKIRGELLISLEPVAATLAMKKVAEAMSQAHSRGVALGELVAHRVFVDPENPEDAQVEIFTRGFKYPGASWRGSPFECIEVRAWGELFRTLLGEYDASETSLYEGKGLRAWKALIADCLRDDTTSRPRFSEIVERLGGSLNAPPPPPGPP